MSTQLARPALRIFAKAITKARTVFEASSPGLSAWLVFYEAKQAAYAQLVASVPQVAAVRDFWRYIQNMPVTQWLPIVEAQIEQTTRSRPLCEECRAVEVSGPTRRCTTCQRATRRETYRESKRPARIKQRMRKCPVCGIQPLDSEQRVCLSCQVNRRRERNRRYQKSLKQRNVRRVQHDFTREDNSTVPPSRSATTPARNVERKAVLTSVVA